MLLTLLDLKYGFPSKIETGITEKSGIETCRSRSKAEMSTGDCNTSNHDDGKTRALDKEYLTDENNNQYCHCGVSFLDFSSEAVPGYVDSTSAPLSTNGDYDTPRPHRSKKNKAHQYPKIVRNLIIYFRDCIRLLLAHSH